MSQPAADEALFLPAPGLLDASMGAAIGYRSTQTTLHRGLPSPSLTLIFSLADPIVTGSSAAEADGERAQRTTILVSGLHQRPAFIAPTPQQAGVQLAVSPLAAGAIFGAPAGELGALVTDGVDVFGAEAERLRQRLVELPTWSGRFALLADYLRRRTADSGVAAPRREVAEAWRWLSWHRGRGSLDSVARHVALSPRQLSTLFGREFGLGVAQAGRLMRFQHTYTAISAAIYSGRRPDLSTIATGCGYADHSHLVRDFHRFAGLSPSAWIAEECRNIQAGGHQLAAQ